MAEVKLSPADTEQLIHCLYKLVERLPAIRDVTHPNDTLHQAPMTPQEVEAHNIKIARTRDRKYAPRQYRVEHVHSD